MALRLGTRPRTSPPRRPRARSASTTTSATAGASSSRTRRTSPRSARPSSGVPRARASSTSGTPSSSASSVDSIGSHNGWKGDIEETQGTALNFPLIADEDRKVADAYDMIHPNANDTLTVRSVFVIGPDKKVKLTLTYPASTGRNVDEILRVLDSFQLTANYKVATPVNWKDGEDVIIVPAAPTTRRKERFPKGFTAVKPYLPRHPAAEPLIRRTAPRRAPRSNVAQARCTRQGPSSSRAARCTGSASAPCGSPDPGVWGPPADPDQAIAVLRRGVELGVDLIDTADSYGAGSPRS